MPRTRDDVTGVILVGGKSRRMGRDKAFLDVGGRTLFEGVLECFREHFRSIVLVGNCAERFRTFDVRVREDLFPGSALGGLYTGLRHAATDTVFVASCDLPFPSTRVLRHLCSLTGDGDAVVPRISGRYEPLFAAYSRRCAGPAGAMLRAGSHRILDLYPHVVVREVSERELEQVGAEAEAFMNVNTPEDYERAVRHAAARRGGERSGHSGMRAIAEEPACA